ncbi:beta-glucoside-specific PTS transporter subunit IIABC [Clostridium ammoniilyticum]|uniref:Beta-glucoside-specific PTS transporter subunit IIABC n=1 Tax=[Clostridium] ammoniilyticum TaxID=2981784 RepID=A0ABT2SW43_9FIRM|nr:beta-glucoside-specific PTS transporter subunit IIABC [[Clostridium] ammoniilyticum]MCU6739043.1 beta-glucoside-specific PTS transporter subunit IIABC [[Clostridium] ammoniilyticum]SCH98172.1 EIIBCA-Bgl [uncultured Clostridium sp.]
MSQKYNDLAQKIVSLVGGKENINTVYHCQTRLRFKLKDESKANQDALNNMDSVAKCLISGGVFQVVIGTHVKDVFEEVEKIVGPLENKEQDQSEKKGILSVIIDFISGTFQPIIPALSGAGMVKAVLAILITFKIISTESQTYYILNFFADAVFYFLPMMLAYSEAQKLRCNPILAASVAGIMMHPNWNALVSAGKAVKLFEVIPFTLTTYTSTVIPVILVVLVQSYIEKYLEKWIPQAVKLVFVPMLTFLIMGPLALAVLGPIGSVLGGYLATFFKFLSTTAAWAPAVLIGGFLPIMVMFGLHNGVAPLGVMQMGELGYDSIFGPGCVCSNIAQATASSVVALRTKDKKMKQLATSGSITAYMGITEPTLYGVNLPKKYPLIASMIGGAAGGLYAGLTHTHRFATGSSGLPAVFLYIGNDTMTYFYNILIALVISFVVTAIVTYVLSLKFENQEVQTIEKVHVNKGEILSPIQGKLYPLSDAKDEAFASETLGKGALIQPSNGKVYAPFDGTIVTLFPTKHAIGIVSDDGIEMLIHFGIDTVNLNGQHFTAFIEQGMKVKQGDLLLEADIEKIKAAGYETQVPVIITNSFNYQNIELSSKEDVSYQDVILKVKGEK